MTAPCLSFAFVGKLSANPLGVAFGLAGWAARKRARSCNEANWISVGQMDWTIAHFRLWRVMNGSYHSRWN